MIANKAVEVNIATDSAQATLPCVLPNEVVIVIVEHGFFKRIGSNPKLVAAVAASVHVLVVEILTGVDDGTLSKLFGHQFEQTFQASVEGGWRNAAAGHLDVNHRYEVNLLRIDHAHHVSELGVGIDSGTEEVVGTDLQAVATRLAQIG